MISAVWNIWLELSPWLLLGAFAGGLLHAFLPPGLLKRHLSGRFGVLKAVIFGIPLPLCSCGVIPVGLGLRKEGASSGASVGFLISTPQTGVDSILVSASFLGWPFAILKVFAALITGVVGGVTTEFLSPTTSADEQAQTTNPTAGEQNYRGRVFDFSLELLSSIWGWVLVGVLVSATITWLVPEGSLADVPGMTGFAALIITLIISLPLYVCATASVPIAAALVASGMPPGAALVFLMAGPATNVATLGAVYRALGWRPLIVYLCTLIAGSLLAGAVFNQVISADVAASHHHDHSSQWWRVASGSVLAVVFLRFAILDLRRWLKERSAQNSFSPDSTITVNVQGMTCNGCAARLESVLESMEQIDRAVVSFDKGIATVSGKASSEEICEGIEKAGFQASSSRPAKSAAM